MVCQLVPALGKRLFTVFINEIASLDLNSILLLFADDSTLVITCLIDQIEQSIKLMEEGVQKIIDWLELNELTLNCDKTELMFIASSENLNRLNQKRLSIIVKGVEILPKDCIRVLVCFIDSKLNFKQHVKTVLRKCYANIGFLKMARPIVSDESMQILAHGFIFAHINYMLSIYGTTTQKILQPINKLIKQCARILLLKESRRSEVSSDMKKKLKWFFVGDLHKILLLCLTFKILKTTNAPKIIRQLLTIVSDVRQRSQRNLTLLLFPAMKTISGERAFSFHASKIWNIINTNNDTRLG